MEPPFITPAVWSVDGGRLLLDWPDECGDTTRVHRGVLAELVDKVNAARERAERAGDVDGWP